MKDQISKRTIFNDYHLESLNRLVKDETEYREFMQALNKTRKGLVFICEVRPELKKEIYPQFTALNRLVGALCPNPNDPNRLDNPFH